MPADSARRPRSPHRVVAAAADKTRSPRHSPAVSELSSDVADSSGSVKSSVDGERRCAGCSNTVYVRGAPLATTDDDDDDDDDVVPLYCRACSSDGAAAAAAAEADESAFSDVADSVSSTTVGSLSDAETERSASETYWDDLGGRALRDEEGWVNCISRDDVYRTYSSDLDDGGACQHSDSESEREHDAPHSPAAAHDRDILDDHPLLRHQLDLDTVSEQREELITVTRGVTRVPSWARDSADVDVPSDDDDDDAKRVPHAGTENTPPAASRARRCVKERCRCQRRDALLDRLRTARTALQMVQVESAARSAKAQLRAGETAHGGSESKAKLRAEVAGLTATLDFLAKLALQRAVELETREETRLRR